MDSTLGLLIAMPVFALVALLLRRRALVVALGYASTILSRVALFNAVPLFSLLGGLLAWMRVRKTPDWARAMPLIAALLFGGLTSLLAILWSADGTEAFTTSLRWLALAPLVLLAINVIRDEGVQGLSKSLLWLSPVVVAQAASTIFFRLSPSSEDAYYQSGLARFFLGDAAGALFTEAGWNNVRELERAGGFLFVSVNRAALVMGVMFLVYLGCWMFTRRLFPLAVAVLLGAAVILGGSKTGLILLIVLPVFALTAAAMSRQRNAATRLMVLLGVLMVAAVSLQVFVSTADEFVTASETTLIPRYVLWGEAIRAIGENVLGGLGFGGWEVRWMNGQVAADFNFRPAHNWLLQAWLDGGILYAIANVALVLAIVRMMLRALRDAPSIREARFVALAANAFLWSFIHGTLDNTPIFGDPQASVFLALAAAIIVVFGRPSDNDVIATSPTASTRRDTAQTNRFRSSRATPARQTFATLTGSTQEGRLGSRVERG